MYIHEIEIRVRYGEVDMMGYLYYGYYSFYYEQARVETMRSLGISYKKMEELGFMLPVRDLNIHFVKPAHYDDVVRIKTMIKRCHSYVMISPMRCITRKMSWLIKLKQL